MWWSQLIPLAPYAASAAATGVALILFLSLKRDLARAARQERRRVDALLDNLRQPAAPPPLPPAETVYVPVVPRPGLNLNRRVHMLRMLRRGEDPARIAAALGVPRREVDLLVRVQALAARGSGS
jgi:hypothetical protein